MHAAHRHGIEPAGDAALAAVLGKLLLRKHVARSLIQIHLAIGHLRQVNEAILQAQQLQIAGGAIESVAAVAGVHANGHVVVAILVGYVHGEHGFAGFKIQDDVLPHAGGQILYIAVDITGGGGQLHNRGVAQIVAAPNALHLVAVFGLDRIHALHAGGDHAVALGQPVHIVDVGVALDGGVAVRISQTRVARAKPVAHDGAHLALAVVIYDGGVFYGHLIALGQIVQHRHAGHHFAGLHIQRDQIDDFLIVGEQYQFGRQRGRAAAAPGQTAAGGLVALLAHLRASAFIGRFPYDLHALVSAQQVAVLVGQDDRALAGGGDAVFRALAGRQIAHINGLGQINGFAVQDRVDGAAGDIAHHALLRALRIDAEAAGGEPQVALVVKHHGQKILPQRLAQRGFGRGLDVDVQHLLKLRQHVAHLVSGAQHQHMVVAGGAYDAVFLIQEGIGALNHVAAAVMLLGGEIAQRLGFLGVQIADGDAAQQRHHRVAIAVKINRGGGVGVGGFIGHVDFGINAHGQHFVRAVGVIAVMMDIGVALGHIGVYIHLLGAERLDGQRGGGSRGHSQAQDRCQRHDKSEKPFHFHILLLSLSVNLFHL